MRRTKFDYRSYHGRKTATDWLKWIALILAILAALAVAALLWGQKNFNYTDEGLKLTLPFFQLESPKPADPGQVDVVIEEEPEPKEDASQPVEPPKPEEATAAAAVPLSALLDGSAAALAAQAVANSVVVEMTDAQGRRGWQAEQPLAWAAKLPGAVSTKKRLVIRATSPETPPRRVQKSVCSNRPQPMKPSSTASHRFCVSSKPMAL